MRYDKVVPSTTDLSRKGLVQLHYVNVSKGERVAVQQPGERVRGA